MQMGFTNGEVKHMTFGEWMDYFDTYKQIYNMRANGYTFKEPRKIDSPDLI